MELALKEQSGLTTYPTDFSDQFPACRAYHINQRDEGIDLGDKAGTLMATSNMQMQTFVTAGFLPESSVTARNIGYQEECAPTLKAGGKSSAVLCFNDQGGKNMGWSEDISGTLRAQEHGHQPLVFENHGIDSRYTGPHSVVPTISARAGTGGNNLPLVAGSSPTSENQTIFRRRRVDAFHEDTSVSTQSARQGKDATDLILTERVSNTPYPLLIRRLVPLECERLQGFPDGWTDLPGAPDSARFKALGNSVAIPCVEHLMLCISLALQDPIHRYQI